MNDKTRFPKTPYPVKYVFMNNNGIGMTGVAIFKESIIFYEWNMVDDSYDKCYSRIRVNFEQGDEIYDDLEVKK